MECIRYCYYIQCTHVHVGAWMYTCIYMYVLVQYTMYTMYMYTLKCSMWAPSPFFFFFFFNAKPAGNEFKIQNI